MIGVFRCSFSFVEGRDSIFRASENRLGFVCVGDRVGKKELVFGGREKKFEWVFIFGGFRFFWINNERY